MIERRGRSLSRYGMILITAVIISIAAPAYSVNILESIRYRKVQMPYQTTAILVNRLTGKAEYIGNEVNWKKISALPEYSQKIYQDMADKESK